MLSGQEVLECAARLEAHVRCLAEALAAQQAEFEQAASLARALHPAPLRRQISCMHAPLFPQTQSGLAVLHYGGVKS
jgi:hypothetical protein